MKAIEEFPKGEKPKNKKPTKPEVIFPLNDVPYEMLRLAWPFRTPEEHQLILGWAKKQTKVRKILFF